MSVTISGILMFAIFLTGLISFHQVSITGNQLMESAMKESRNLSVDRDRTNIIIQDSSFDSESCTLALHLKNTGSRSVTSLKSMDLIIQLKGANASVLIPNYIESSSVLSKGGWKIPSFGDLEFEPGILNPGEIVEIQTRLDIPVPGETIGRTMVVTPNGVSAERQLGSLQTPC